MFTNTQRISCYRRDNPSYLAWRSCKIIHNSRIGTISACHFVRQFALWAVITEREAYFRQNRSSAWYTKRVQILLIKSKGGQGWQKATSRQERGNTFSSKHKPSIRNLLVWNMVAGRKEWFRWLIGKRACREISTKVIYEHAQEHSLCPCYFQRSYHHINPLWLHFTLPE